MSVGLESSANLVINPGVFFKTSTVTTIVAGLKEGLNTAFYTTICGIVFSLPLQAQLMILKFKLEEDGS